MLSLSDRTFPPRIRAVKAAGFVVLACIFAAAAGPAARMLWHWFSIRKPELLGLDYMRYCASALMGRRFGWSHLYDPAAQARVTEALGIPLFLPNVYTPVMSLFASPFTFLSAEQGFLLWSALLLLSLVVCWWLLAPGDAPARVVQLALLLVPYPVALGLQQGQVIPIQMALVAVSYALLKNGRDLVAGAALVAVALKPQGMQLIPFALLVAGRRRAFAGWVAATALLGAGVLLLIGVDGARAYLDRLAWAQRHPLQMMVAWDYTLARHFQSSAGRTAALVSVAALALVAARRHRENPEIVYGAAIIGSLLASPYLHLYDFMWLFPAGWLVVRAIPAPLALLPIAACYVFLLFSTHDGKGARWVLLSECVGAVALALAPAAWINVAPRRRSLSPLQ